MAVDPGQRTKLLTRVMGQPVNRALMASFVLVAVVPLALLGMKLYRAAWDDAWREIQEKHQLLAQNLAAPISIYVEDHRHALALLASSLEQPIQGEDVPKALEEFLGRAAMHLRGFRSISLVDTDGRTLYTSDPHGAMPGHADVFADETCFLRARNQGAGVLSGVKPSPLTGKPTVLLSQPVRDSQGGVRAVLLGELRIDMIEKLRRNIRFGKRGHSAIVDRFGHVVAHPNPDWMEDMHDLSSWPIVKAMMAGKTGVTEFYSSFVKQSMVAGYASVPGIGWGVMVPQPKAEVESRVADLLWAEFAWGVFGLVLGLILAVALARWIANPLRRLALATNDLAEGDFKGKLPPAPSHAPREVRQLAGAFATAFERIEDSRARYDGLNRLLQHRVDEATQDLRDANVRLEDLARKDHLTTLTNRRHFEEVLIQRLKVHRKAVRCMCILLLDVDNFKYINDAFGHAAGDAVLIQLAHLLAEQASEHELVARYGGDEFVLQMDCIPETGRHRARNILASIARHSFRWHDQELPLTVSIGLLCTHGEEAEDADAEVLLRRIDQALYRAKDAGKNRLVEVDELRAGAAG